MYSQRAHGRLHVASDKWMAMLHINVCLLDSFALGLVGATAGHPPQVGIRLGVGRSVEIVEDFPFLLVPWMEFSNIAALHFSIKCVFGFGSKRCEFCNILASCREEQLSDFPRGSRSIIDFRI